MSAESGIEDDLAMRQDVSGLAVVNHGRCHQTKTRVVVLVVVPLKEGLAEAAGIFDGTEAIREAWAVFQGAELAFRIRIVIGDMRTAVGFDDAQIGQQQRHRFGFHGRAAIGMDGELTGRGHLHALIAGFPQHALTTATCFAFMKIWEQMGGGMARVHLYSPLLDGVGYVLKDR